MDVNHSSNNSKQIKSQDRINNIAIDVLAYRTLKLLLKENPVLETLINKCESSEIFLQKIVELAKQILENYKYKFNDNDIVFKDLQRTDAEKWKCFAAIRLLDYAQYTGVVFNDPNIRINKTTVNDPLGVLWRAARFGRGGARNDFFMDMLYLFRQLNGTLKFNKPDIKLLGDWMSRHPSGLDANIVKQRKSNKKHIIELLIKRIDNLESKNSRYFFSKEASREEKYKTVEKWWKDYRFHLAFAVKTPEMLDEMLDHSLSYEKMELLREAQKQGIPIFVNPYYLSLLNHQILGYAAESDRTIRDYIFLNRELVKQYGSIVAWEMEDIVEPDRPNAAGWMLPLKHNIHRRYPEVAIIIPDTTGRACGGLCVSCQRMYDFQNGHLNFNLDKLKPRSGWNIKLEILMSYFEHDSQLRDILITGGDALMNTDKSLKKILDAVVAMAIRKRDANKQRKHGEKYAEIVRVRIGSRLPAYLPQRITQGLIRVLKDFREKAEKAGIKQFVIQTHFVSAMEITPEARKGIRKILQSGWMVVNQNVFTAAGSRRGHTAQLRAALNHIGVLTYYTFTVKGYLENSYNFAPNARTVQEQFEEKNFGNMSAEADKELLGIISDTKNLPDNISALLQKHGLPFISSDRNVMNLPGVGKSMTFRVVGITRYGKRILAFSYDKTRPHSPAIKNDSKILIVESKSIMSYLKQIEKSGENISEYESIWGYSLSVTEARNMIFEYPDYSYEISKNISNYCDTDKKKTVSKGNTKY